MPVRKRAIKSFKHLNVPISYKTLDDSFLSDARNVFDNKKVTETRYGIKGFNAVSLGGPILSLSYFKTSAGVRYRIAKVGTSLYVVNATGVNTLIKSGLSATTKHRGVTLNNRHIIAIESDGLFSFNGTFVTQLGQLPPTTGNVAISAGGNLVAGDNYKVGLTFYSTVTGFETNAYTSSQITPSGGNTQIDVTSIPATADNQTIDKVRIYLKNVTQNGAYLFITELNLGTTSYTISAIATSTQIPPTLNAPPIAGGGRYLTLFGKSLVYTGNSTYPNDVYVSEDYLPDAFDSTSTQVVLEIPGQGPITGITTGLFNDTLLSPFVAIFKKTTIAIYSEISGSPELNTIDTHLGCVSNETIRVRNGSIYFMSENGWYVITNGSIVRDDKGMPISLGKGNIDDIFSRVGWTYELNAPQFSSFFSAYYSTDAIYMTFVAEGANNSITKAYTFEERLETPGFRVFEFKTPLTCGCEGEDESGYQTVFLGDESGKLFSYSSRNSRYDEDASGNQQTIPAFAILPYLQPGDSSCSYNFRDLTVRAFGSSNPITIRTFASFSLQTFDSFQYDFPNTSLGFTLDVSILDEDTLGDERIPVTAMADINRTGETLLIGFYQDILSANLGLISSQISLNKNGNRNT
jgi:hypothetical protein